MKKSWRYSVVISSWNILEANPSKTAKIIKKAEERGVCVLFVDEAYTLCFPSEHDFGKEIVEMLMAKMNNNITSKIKNLIMMFAGYKKQMNNF